MALGQGIDATLWPLVAHDRELAEKGAANPDGVVLLNTPPLMHGAAQWGTLGQLAQGNTVVLMPRFDAQDVWSTVERENANSIMIAGDAMGRPMIEALEAYPDRWELSSLFAVTSSAALFSVPVKQRYFELMPHLLIIDSIGSSEGGFNGLSAVGKDNPTGGSSGGLPRVSPMADVIVVDDDMQPLSPGDGRIGKVARTGNIPLGYYKDEEKTARTFLTGPNGRRYVVAGDFARWEEDGSVTLLGRGSVCINSGGEKIFPEEVEGVYKAHPDVFDVLVVGVPDDRWGNAVTAVVQPTDGAKPDLESLNDAARSKLASYKLPRHLVLVEEIVRSPAGKPDYPWAAKHAAEVVASRP
jgi:3-oxocholest-4-en-26-oate---CoA ligase